MLIKEILHLLLHVPFLGYDSDVEREAKMDYSTKIYAVNMRETTGTKPNLQEKKEKEK